MKYQASANAASPPRDGGHALVAERRGFELQAFGRRLEAQAITNAKGKPSINTRMNTRSTQVGAANAGNAMLATWTTSHAITT